MRDELEARGLDSKGVKNSLIQRLQEALGKEKMEDEGANIKNEPKLIEKMETEEVIKYDLSIN